VEKFRSVLDCGIAMGQASNAINSRMLMERLPPVRYRISADYGQVSVARSQSSQSEDLFGPAMNNAAKINSMARQNGLIIGERLYEVVKGLDEYAFEPTELAEKSRYSGHHVSAKQ
jgi:class 3 adenylate cyclase